MAASAPIARAPCLVVVGSANVDLVVAVEHIPAAGETVSGGDLHRYPGGKGANQALAARRLGAEVVFIGCIGTDAFGELALSRLQAEGVDLTHLRRLPDVPTGVALIAVAADGQNSIVVAPGANARIDRSAVTSAQAAIQAADAVIAQLEVPSEAVVHAFTLARAASVRTILNPAPARPLAAEVLALVDCLILNESEATILVGRPVDDPATAIAAAHALLAQGPPQVIVTLGARGSVLLTSESALAIPAIPVIARDTTAAGDAFVAAYACQIARGAAPGEAARYAAAAGALKATREGAQAGLPTAAEVAALQTG